MEDVIEIKLPEQIEAVACQLIGASEALRLSKESLALLEAQILFEILAEKDPQTEKPVYTNDKQREAAMVVRLGSDERVIALKVSISQQDSFKKQLEARLECLRGLFSLEKIERRERLMALEAGNAV